MKNPDFIEKVRILVYKKKDLQEAGNQKKLLILVRFEKKSVHATRDGQFMLMHH